MRKQFICGVKVAWTVAALVALLMYIGACSSNEACRPVGDTMLFFMGVVTFPAGLLCIILSVIVCGLLGGEYPRSEFTIWFLLVCGGCLQWYVVVPLLLEEPRLTLLNLHTTLPIPASAAATAAKPDLSIATPSTVSVIQAPRKPHARKRHHQVLPFDKFGRTPLERVINHHARDASA